MVSERGGGGGGGTCPLVSMAGSVTDMVVHISDNVVCMGIVNYCKKTWHMCVMYNVVYMCTVNDKSMC